jgi:hypothetical protein
MKRFTSLLLTVLMLLSLAACGGETVPPPDSSSQGESADGLEGKTDTAELERVPFTETVVIDNEECKIVINDIEIEPKPDSDNLLILTLDVFIENKSTDKEYLFDLHSVAINGVYSEALFNFYPLGPGKKLNWDIIINNSNDSLFYKNDVGNYTDIELRFRVKDNNQSDIIATGEVKFYPYGEEKATKFVREAQPSDKVLLDNEYLTAIYSGYKEHYKPDELNEPRYCIYLFLLNKTDKDISSWAEECSINGIESVLAGRYLPVGANKCAFYTLSWFDEGLEKKGITEVEEIEFTLDTNFNDEDYASNMLHHIEDYKITFNP